MRTSHHDRADISPEHKDPAIAAVGPSTGRRGGYGEGFGFGWGIGHGRGMAKGATRNIGWVTVDSADTRLRRQPPRTAERAPHAQTDRRDQEPAWMDDVADPAIAAMDSFTHYTPGVDMIAKHKQAMKSEPPKPKSFNSADYLITKKVEPDEPEAPASGGSRFQRFFSPPPDPPAPSEDDRAARLMGMLSMVGNAIIKADLELGPAASAPTNLPAFAAASRAAAPRLSATLYAAAISPSRLRTTAQSAQPAPAWLRAAAAAAAAAILSPTRPAPARHPRYTFPGHETMMHTSHVQHTSFVCNCSTI